jgi:hypothetical protein
MQFIDGHDGPTRRSGVFGTDVPGCRTTTRRLVSTAAAVCFAGSWLAVRDQCGRHVNSHPAIPAPGAVQNMATLVAPCDPCSDTQHYIFGINSSYTLLLACRPPGPTYVPESRHLIGTAVPGGNCNIPGQELAQSFFDGTPLLCVRNPAPTTPFDKAVWGTYQDDP